jgi:hypothetical protein
VGGKEVSIRCHPEAVAGYVGFWMAPEVSMRSRKMRGPPASGRVAPVIDSFAGTENEELTVTVSGHVTY